jgi:hypothetical protein
VKYLFRKPIAIVLGLVVVGLLWFAFRPELLFVNAPVNDPFPTSVATTAPAHV